MLRLRSREPAPGLRPDDQVLPLDLRPALRPDLGRPGRARGVCAGARSAGSFWPWWGRAARPWASTAWPTRRSTPGTPAPPLASCPAACSAAGRSGRSSSVRPALLVLAAWRLNPLCLALSPVALAIVFGYSYTKRFTALVPPRAGPGPGGGSGGSLDRHPGAFRCGAPRPRPRRAPVGGGLRHHLRLPGRRVRPQRGPALGPRRAWGSRARSSWRAVLHVGAGGLLLALYFIVPLHPVYLLGVAGVAALLAYEHSLVRPTDLSRVDVAFFTLNGWISVGYCAATVLAVAARRAEAIIAAPMEPRTLEAAVAHRRRPRTSGGPVDVRPDRSALRPPEPPALRRHRPALAPGGGGRSRPRRRRRACSTSARGRRTCSSRPSGAAPGARAWASTCRSRCWCGARPSSARRGLSPRAALAAGDGEQLPLRDRLFDGALVSFGIRNIGQPALALREIHRVLRPGGRLVILEFSMPKGLLGALYRFYFGRVLPRIGGLVSGDAGGLCLPAGLGRALPGSGGAGAAHARGRLRGRLLAALDRRHRLPALRPEARGPGKQAGRVSARRRRLQRTAALLKPHRAALARVVDRGAGPGRARAAGRPARVLRADPRWPARPAGARGGRVLAAARGRGGPGGGAGRARPSRPWPGPSGSSTAAAFRTCSKPAPSARPSRSRCSPSTSWATAGWRSCSRPRRRNPPAASSRPRSRGCGPRRRRASCSGRWTPCGARSARASIGPTRSGPSPRWRAGSPPSSMPDELMQAAASVIQARLDYTYVAVVVLDHEGVLVGRWAGRPRSGPAQRGPRPGSAGRDHRPRHSAAGSAGGGRRRARPRLPRRRHRHPVRDGGASPRGRGGDRASSTSRASATTTSTWATWRRGRPSPSSWWWRCGTRASSRRHSRRKAPVRADEPSGEL